ncbi:hypothetical protein HanPSC8_Chr10g0428401 [Helianthus annuus]|nr:hypothetical protein HanPSC8_Chr10g0428401 [Helianthus annuus]
MSVTRLFPKLQHYLQNQQSTCIHNVHKPGIILEVQNHKEVSFYKRRKDIRQEIVKARLVVYLVNNDRPGRASWMTLYII